MAECVSLLPFEILNEYDASVVDAQLYTSLLLKKLGFLESYHLIWHYFQSDQIITL